MNYLTLNDLKKHLNVDTTFTDDDDYIASLGDVAESIVSKHLDCDLSEIVAYSNGELPMPIIQAMKLLVGNLYMNRESVAFVQAHNIPLSYEYLLDPYVKYTQSKL